MTALSRSPELQAALEERDNLKIQLHLLRENGGSPREVLAATKRASELDEQIHEMRRGLFADPVGRKRGGGAEAMDA